MITCGQLKSAEEHLSIIAKGLVRQRRERTDVTPVKSLNAPGERQEQIIWNVLVLKIGNHNKFMCLALFGTPCRCLFRCYSRSKCRELFSTAHVWCLDVAKRKREWLWRQLSFVIHSGKVVLLEKTLFPCAFQGASRTTKPLARALLSSSFPPVPIVFEGGFI